MIKSSLKIAFNPKLYPSFPVSMTSKYYLFAWFRLFCSTNFEFSFAIHKKINTLSISSVIKTIEPRFKAQNFYHRDCLVQNTLYMSKFWTLCVPHCEQMIEYQKIKMGFIDWKYHFQASYLIYDMDCIK